MKLTFSRTRNRTAKGDMVHAAQTATHRFYVHRAEENAAYWDVEVYRLMEVGTTNESLGIESIWIAEKEPMKILLGVDFADAKDEAQAFAEQAEHL
jgi:hypothetical protein